MSKPFSSPFRTIVVVEDEDLLRDIAVSEFADAGLHAVGFRTADEALQHLVAQAANTAVVFTDVQMPGRLNGLELCSIVCRTWPTIRVVVTSGGALVNPTRLPRRAQFMPKPWRAADLVARIGDLLSPMVEPLGYARLDAAMV